jgi:UDP-N-acetylmuramyl pentapeptide phosphotransferase/UDP-N-acetylglucosamine-1-phosphate transferase
MGSWSLAVSAGICLVLLGLVTHWSLIVVGALLPVWPVVSALLQRRRQRGSEAD